ncbi:MAG: hypothetical protein AAGF74_01995 [Pseudomonadota bacterium]
MSRSLSFLTASLLVLAAAPIAPVTEIVALVAAGHPRGTFDAETGWTTVEIETGDGFTRFEHGPSAVQRPICILVLQSGLGLGRVTLADLDCDSVVETVKFDDDDPLSTATADFDQLFSDTVSGIAEALRDTAPEPAPAKPRARP